MMTPKEQAVVSIQNESETVSSLSMMRTVMQQALEALEELFHSNSTKVAVEKYNTAHNALLEALEQPNEIDWIETNKALAKEIIELKKQAEQEPDYFGLTHDHTWLSIDKKQYDKLKPEGRMTCYAAPQPNYKALWEQMCKRCDELDLELAKYTEQEPVGEMIDKAGYKGAAWYLEPPATGTKLYTAPVRIKDLTDDEIVDVMNKIYGSTWTEQDRDFARAVIAADREKNK